MNIDYNKVSQINSAIDKLLARMKEIDDTCSRLSSSSSYRYMSEEQRRGLADYTKSLQKERACLFEVYLKDVEELHACFNIN